MFDALQGNFRGRYFSRKKALVSSRGFFFIFYLMQFNAFDLKKRDVDKKCKNLSFQIFDMI